MKVSKLQIFYLSALSMLSFIATDMYLPAFATMQQYFATGPQYLALSLTVFLVGMGFGQISWGIISDRYGYKRSLLVGLFLFTSASCGLMMSENISQLLIFRFIQAIGVCAPAVIWQAMVIERFPERTGQQLFATIMPLVALSPALAPQLGVVLLNTLGWQSIFAMLSLFGIILIGMTLNQPENTKKRTTETHFFEDIKSLVTSKEFMGNITTFAFASAAFFSYLTSLPEIMDQLGYSPSDIGMSFIPQTIVFIVGGSLGKRLVRKYGDNKVLPLILLLFSISAITILVVCQYQLTSIWPILLPFCLIAMANGALYPIVVNRALVSVKHCASTAAGFQNSFQIAISSLASSIVATLIADAQIITGLIIFVCMIGVWFGFIMSTPRLSSKFTTPDVIQARELDDNNE